MLDLDDKNAFATSFITRSDIRRRGLGKQTWQACMDVVAGKNIILNAAVNREDMYNKLGFVACKNRMRFSDYMFPLKKKEPSVSINVASIVDYDKSLFQKVYEYDQKIQPINRRDFIENHMNKSDIVKVVLQRDKVAGFICLRKNYKGYVIMPLYANSPDIAKQLLQPVAESLGENTDVKVGIPCGNPKAEEVFTDVGWFPIPYKPINVKLRMQTTIDYRDQRDETKVYSVMNYSYVLI